MGPEIVKNEGKKMVVQVGDQFKLRQWVNALLYCGHAHNFQVEQDGLRVYTTQLGMNCLQKFEDSL